MKKIIFTLLAMVAFMGVDAQPRGPYKGDVITMLNAIEQRGDMLYLDIDFNIDKLAMNKTQSWSIVPEIIGADNRGVSLPYILINGKNKRQMYERKLKFENTRLLDDMPYMVVNVNKDTKETLNYVMTLPWEPWMADATLVIREVLTSCREQQQLFVTDIAKYVNVPDVVLPVPAVSLIQPQKEAVKERNVQAQAYLDFQVGRSVILPDFRRNPEELAKIRETLSNIQNNRDVTVTGLFVEGYASPEGSYELNTRLARDRAEALVDYIVKNYNISRSMIRSSSVPEDWDGLRVLVQQSNLADRSAILDIIDSNMDPDAKNSKIQTTYPNSYKTMLSEMYPKLRRVEYRVDFTVRDYELEESKDILNSDPNLLSQYELYRLANTYAVNSPEYINVYNIVDRNFPNDETANINVATALYQRGEYTAAKNKLSRVSVTNPQALNLLGAIAVAEGNTDAALDYFNRARNMGNTDAEKNYNDLNRIINNLGTR